jgi:DNA-binding response OmpR family regulator
MDEQSCVLVVEDHAPLRELIETVLGGAGYQVITAAGADEAIGIGSRSRVDLLLTDVKMPGRSGEDLVRWFRARSSAPVVFMSGADPTMLKPHISSVHFLPKPFTAKSLLAVVMESLTHSI